MSKDYITSDELCHYGIPGMKWGVRRYQNSDGSLTDAGQKKYNRYRSSYGNMVKAGWDVRTARRNRDRNAVKTAKENYKVAKNNYKEDNKKLQKSLTKNLKVRDKNVLYKQSYIQKEAAKYMHKDKNLTAEQALKKARIKAWKQTGASVAANVAINSLLANPDAVANRIHSAQYRIDKTKSGIKSGINRAKQYRKYGPENLKYREITPESNRLNGTLALPGPTTKRRRRR